MDVVLVVLGVLLMVAVVAFFGLLVWAGRVRRLRTALPAAGPQDVEARAVGLTDPYRTFGVLRLTPRDLLFAGSGLQVLTVPRSVIVACVASEDVPTGSGMATAKRKALVVQIDDPTLPQALAFMVDDPGAWVSLLRAQA